MDSKAPKTSRIVTWLMKGKQYIYMYLLSRNCVTRAPRIRLRMKCSRWFLFFLRLYHLSVLSYDTRNLPVSQPYHFLLTGSHTYINVACQPLPYPQRLAKVLRYRREPSSRHKGFPWKWLMFHSIFYRPLLNWDRNYRKGIWRER